MAKANKTPAFMRVGNMLATAMVRLGLKVGPIHLLTVRGRKSNQPRTTPIAVVEQQGKRYLIAPYGAVNWVRNLRVAGGMAALTRSHRTEAIRAIELEPKDAAPVLKETLRTGGGGSFIRRYFSVTATSSLEEFEREVASHPVFLLQSIA